MEKVFIVTGSGRGIGREVVLSIGQRGDFPVIIEKAANSSSMKGNPIRLTTEEMEAILRQAL